MKKALFVVLTVLLMSYVVNTAMALTFTPAKAPWDSKPAKLSLVDQVWLSAEPIVMSSLTKVNVLVNRVTRKVEYVWSYKYNRYVRPKYSMPNIQDLYNSVHSKDK